MTAAPDSLRGEHRSQCTACGELFNRTSLFDKHRTGTYSERRCLNNDEMTAKGWRKLDSGYWVGPARIIAEPV
jgi:hypothetical protein